MCGRFVASASAADLAEAMEVDEVRVDDVAPSYNVAPTMDVFAVADHRGARALGAFRWGLIPPWAKSPRDGAKFINARAETVAESPMFRGPFSRHRCLIPANGFYEWEKVDAKTRLPWFYAPTNGGLFAFAGIWGAWREPGASDADPDGGWIRSCSIITTTANAVLAPVHDRMPVIVARDDWATWLARDTDPGEAQMLLRPAPDEAVTARRVATDVNNVKNDDPTLLRPVGT